MVNKQVNTGQYRRAEKWIRKKAVYNEGYTNFAV
jgi:hypothetical protein